MPSKLDVKCKGKGCKTMIARQTRTGLCQPCWQESRRRPLTLSPAVQIDRDRDKARYKAELLDLRARYKESLKTIEEQEGRLHTVRMLTEHADSFAIAPKLVAKHSESTVVMVASDWHVEERVKRESVSGLNAYTLDTAKARATKFFQSGLRLIQILQQDTTVDTLVLALLGDFISNDIHEEFSENNEVTPMHAIVTAQNLLISGIEFLLKRSKLNLVIPCHSGNHARTTKTVHFSSENGHSLEYLMYLHLAAYFRSEPRVTFIIPEGYHSYVKVYDQTIRFHHGHAIKYGGGVGGIFVPAYKAISQWDKARPADLDVFGHFHQSKDGGNFLCNGSLIGYNAFALAIKADYEKPKQQLFVINKKLGRTCTWPILVE